MDESSAMQVIAVRALETADGARTVWSDDDRQWASRAAAEVVGADAAPATFVARRAALVLERLGERHPVLPRAVRALRWRPWLGQAVIGFAFVLGLFLDQVDGNRRINILAPPVLGLLAWNVAVYVLVGIGFVVRYGDAAPPGPLRAAIARLAAGTTRLRGDGATRAAIAAFGADWTGQSASLYAIRATRILHYAAAMLAAGVLAGLYLRGLAFEFQANWESTFLDAPTVRTLLAFVYAPGALLTGLAVPDAAAVAAIRAPGGENAARWLHLMAATVVAVVIAPRLLLAVVASVVERRRATRFAIAAGDPYFQRLLRGFRGGASRVRVIPYSCTLDAPAIAGLEAIVARAFGGSAALVLAPAVPYGAEDAFPSDTTSGSNTVLIALFKATATPERETHGAFLSTLAGPRADAAARVALVDESGWTARWGADAARRAERRAAWQAVAAEAKVRTVFADLANPDLANADAAFDAALGGEAP